MFTNVHGLPHKHGHGANSCSCVGVDFFEESWLDFTVIKNPIKKFLLVR